MPLKKCATKGLRTKVFPTVKSNNGRNCRSCCIYGGVTEALIVKGHEEVQAIIYLWWTVSNASLMTKCQPFFHVYFVSFLCAHSPGGHEDLGNVWRNIALCKGFPESRRTIRCSLLCSGCVCWLACCGRLFEGFIIQGWKLNFLQSIASASTKAHPGSGFQEQYNASWLFSLLARRSMFSSGYKDKITLKAFLFSIHSRLSWNLRDLESELTFNLPAMYVAETHSCHRIHQSQISWAREFNLGILNLPYY